MRRPSARVPQRALPASDLEQRAIDLLPRLGKLGGEQLVGDPAARLFRAVAVDLARLTVPVCDGARGRLAHDDRVVGEVHQPLSLRQLVQQIPALGDVAPEAHTAGDHAGRVRQRLDAHPVAEPAIRLVDLKGTGPACQRGAKERFALL